MCKICPSNLLIENKWVRVTWFDFELGEETGWHDHVNGYVITAITDCYMILENLDRTKSISEIKKGNAFKREAGVSHNVLNASEKIMTFIEIELKA